MTVEEAELEIDEYNDTRILDAQVTFSAEVGGELCALCERLIKIAHDSIEAMKKNLPFEPFGELDGIKSMPAYIMSRLKEFLPTS